MRDVLDRLEKIADTSSKKEKERLVLEGLTEDPLFEYVCKQALDPFRTYGIRPELVHHARTDDDLTIKDIETLLHRLAARDLTGTEAVRAVEHAMRNVHWKTAHVLWRILMKDLRAGFTASTVNRVKPGTIPVFEVMLAHKYEEKRIKAFPVSVEPKLDGVRVICVVTPGQAKFYSRTGKEFPALAHLEPVILKGFEAAWTHEPYEGDKGATIHRRFFRPEGLVLDGEMVSGSFNKSVGDIRRKDEAATDAVFNVFDVLPLADFAKADEIKLPYKARRWAVISFRSFANDPRIIQTPRFEARSHDEILSYYTRFRNDGYEGAIVKPLDATYTKSRSYAWLKIKAVNSDDLVVVDMFEGERHTKYQGAMGGLIVKRGEVLVRVGGGFSDQQRREFWDNRDLVIGRMAEIEYHEVTPDGSLRHPRFLRFRSDLEPGF